VTFTFGAGRTPGTADQCEYVGCHDPGAGESRYHNLLARNGIPWTMCAEHLKPEYHPVIERGKLAKW
jgi:hypothetical protein